MTDATTAARATTTTPPQAAPSKTAAATRGASALGSSLDRGRSLLAGLGFESCPNASPSSARRACGRITASKPSASTSSRSSGTRARSG
jgi:hypothetical protein